MRKLQRFSLFSMQFCLFSINSYYSDSSFCRAASLCRALEDQWRPATSHCPTAMVILNKKCSMEHDAERQYDLPCSTESFVITSEPAHSCRSFMIDFLPKICQQFANFGYNRVKHRSLRLYFWLFNPYYMTFISWQKKFTTEHTKLIIDFSYKRRYHSFPWSLF